MIHLSRVYFFIFSAHILLSISYFASSRPVRLAARGAQRRRQTAENVFVHISLSAFCFCSWLRRRMEQAITSHFNFTYRLTVQMRRPLINNWV